jgi:hypothetical protein
MSTHLDAFQRALCHPIAHQRPTPDFFSGALLGNGGLGAVVCTRPEKRCGPDWHGDYHMNDNARDIEMADVHADESYSQRFDRVEIAVTNTLENMLYGAGNLAGLLGPVILVTGTAKS